jgi:aryl-alcohol dehydrogenase-like predicted oxidoreductase
MSTNASRPLGNSELSTPALILGGNVFGWTADRKTSFAILDAFVAGGGLMVDTADSYSVWVPGHSGGESETIIGEWLTARGRRDDVLIATKVGGEVFGGRGLAPARITASVEGSLKRLRTDYIDLYYAHYDDPSTPIEDSLAVFDALVRSGKVRAIGVSNHTPDRLKEALDTSAARNLASYSVLQPEFNLVERQKFEGPLQTLCLERGLAAVPYFALASGFLSGKYRSIDDTANRARGGAVAHYLNDFGLGVLRAVETVAAEASATPAQVALAWLAAQPAVAAPIASATSVAQVEELLGSLRLTLTGDQLARLDEESRA